MRPYFVLAGTQVVLSLTGGGCTVVTLGALSRRCLLRHTYITNAPYIGADKPVAAAMSDSVELTNGVLMPWVGCVRMLCTSCHPR
jgi:hypothetical protein